MKKMLLLLLLLPLILFINTGCDNDSNADQSIEEVEELAVEFLQNVISGTVVEKISDNEYMLQLELSPNTVFIAILPVRTTGSITTESFYNNFDLNFQDAFPNVVLSINVGDAAMAIPFELKSPVFDPQTGVLEVIASPLEITSDSGEMPVNIISFDDIESPFGQSVLFIDDATNTCQGLVPILLIDDSANTCQGLVLGQCISGDSSGEECAIDGQCQDLLGATCVGGSPGQCSITGEGCVDDQCCATGVGCLTSSPDLGDLN